MDNDGIRSIKDAFAKAFGKYDGKELLARVARSAAAGGKAAVDKGLVEFPQAFVNKAAKDVYGFLTSQELADGISTTVRSFDEEKVKGLVDQAAASLKNPETALKIAKQVKDVLSKTSADDLENQIDGMLSGRSLNERMMFQMLFAQVKPVIEEMKTMSEQEVADKIMNLADNIPSDAIAAQVAALTREVTPERISKQAHDTVGKLPSPKAVADIVHGIGNAASKALDDASKATTVEDAAAALRNLKQNATDLVTDTLEKDQKAKKTFKRKGQDFKL